MRPRCSVLVSPILTGGFDFSGCGDFMSCPPVERAAMSNSDPSAIVLHGIPCIGGLYTSFDSNGENGSLVVRSGFAPIHPFQIAHEVSNWVGRPHKSPAGPGYVLD